jgi:hypothetical protein
MGRDAVTILNANPERKLALEQGATHSNPRYGVLPTTITSIGLEIEGDLTASEP